MVCSGLGTTRRGYEVFFASLNRHLVHHAGLDVHLFKGGGGRQGNQRRVWNLPRRSAAARRLGEWLGVGDPRLGRGYYIEQATFLLGLVPHLLAGRPDLVYFSDKNLGDLLARWRLASRQSFRLLFRNGGPYPPPYPRFDYVQQLTGPLRQAALAAGCPDSQQILLPAGFDITADFEPLGDAQRSLLRTRLGLPPERFVVLSVGALNATHKRLDYLVRELARLPEPRPYLVMLGQPDAETPGIVRLAEQTLGPAGFAHHSVPAEQVADYYRCADLFVLASLREGFGRVWVEALAHGLPSLAHDFPVARDVLGEHGRFADFTADGALAELIGQHLRTPHSPALARARHGQVYQRFSWDRLLPRYVDMLVRCARPAGGR